MARNKPTSLTYYRRLYFLGLIPGIIYVFYEGLIKMNITSTGFDPALLIFYFLVLSPFFIIISGLLKSKINILLVWTVLIIFPGGIIYLLSTTNVPFANLTSFIIFCAISFLTVITINKTDVVEKPSKKVSEERINIDNEISPIKSKGHQSRSKRNIQDHGANITDSEGAFSNLNISKSPDDVYREFKKKRIVKKMVRQYCFNQLKSLSDEYDNIRSVDEFDSRARDLIAENIKNLTYLLSNKGVELPSNDKIIEFCYEQSQPVRMEIEKTMVKYLEKKILTTEKMESNNGKPHLEQPLHVSDSGLERSSDQDIEKEIDKLISSFVRMEDENTGKLD